MSKTYRLPVKGMAQLISGTTYDKNAESYKQDTYLPLFWQFDALPSALEGLDPAMMELHFYQTVPSGEYNQIAFFRLQSKLDIENDQIPVNTLSENRVSLPQYQNSGWKVYTYETFNQTSRREIIHSYIRDGLATKHYAHYPETIYSPLSSYPPYAILTYDEGSLVAFADGPGGYIDRTAPNVFSWHTTWTGFPVENVAQTSATLQWKNGESGTVNSITISGSSTTYTMPANTLPESSELYWRVQTTTASGTATSDWRAVRTVDTEGFCAGISPSGAYIDGTEETRFVWTYSTASGAAPSGYDLQIKGTADADFRTITSATTADTFALIPAGTLPGGSLQWRVRGYNQSGVAGEWSEPLSCVVISAPAAPEVWIEQASPRPTVAWSAVGQLAFEVRAGSYSSGTIFGTDKSFKIPAYLPDGQTAVQVRVLGEYDLWSPYGQTSLTVANAGSGEILLTAQAQSGDAALSWTVAENATGYQILRGGKLIAETAETAYLDPYSIGSVTYRVRAVLPGDDYILSNPTSVQLSVPCPRIRALDGGWIELDTYTTPLPSLQITATRDVALMQYAGHDYPIPEVSRHRTRTWIASPAFSDHTKAAAFEQLLGRVVYVKDQYGSSLVGVMSSVQRMPSRFYTELTAVVQEIGGFDV